MGETPRNPDDPATAAIEALAESWLAIGQRLEADAEGNAARAPESARVARCLARLNELHATQVRDALGAASGGATGEPQRAPLPDTAAPETERPRWLPPRATLVKAAGEPCDVSLDDEYQPAVVPTWEPLTAPAEGDEMLAGETAEGQAAADLNGHTLMATLVGWACVNCGKPFMSRSQLAAAPCEIDVHGGGLIRAVDAPRFGEGGIREADPWEAWEVDVRSSIIAAHPEDDDAWRDYVTDTMCDVRVFTERLIARAAAGGAGVAPQPPDAALIALDLYTIAERLEEGDSIADLPLGWSGTFARLRQAADALSASRETDQ